MKNLNKKILIASLISIFSLLPLFSFAASSTADGCNSSITNIGDMLCKVSSLLKTIVPILVLLGVVYFVWGVVTYFINGDEEAKKKGRDRIVYGLLGFVVIFALWGLTSIVVNTFKLDQGTNIASNFIQGNNNILGNNSAASGGSCSLPNTAKLGDLFDYATCVIIKSIIPLLIALSVLMFIWGVVQYVINTDEEAKKARGKQFMIWGIIGLTVMVGVWGLVAIVGNTFGIQYAIPQVK